MTTTTNGTRRRLWDTENWTTTAVTAAPPGWFAIYRNHDKTHSTRPCVALLTQECNETTWTEETKSTGDRQC